MLRKDGCFYLNIGDSYAGSGSAHAENHANPGISQSFKRQGVPHYGGLPERYLAPKGLQPKCMACIPERVLFAMLDDGWILRNKIVWHKRNPMPSSVKDRFTQTWEYLYFFTKSKKYYFDLDAVRQPHKTASIDRYMSAIKRGEGGQGKLEAGIGAVQHRAGMDGIVAVPKDIQDIFGHGPQPQSFNLRVRDVKRGKKGTSAQGGELKASDQEIDEYEYPEKHHGSSMSNQPSLHRDRPLTAPHHRDSGDGWEAQAIEGRQQKHASSDIEPQSPARKHHSGYFGEDGQPLVDLAKGKNPGDVWSISTKPSSISVCPNCETVFKRLLKVCPNCHAKGIVGHFAPYPEGLCIDPIKASTREGDVVLDCFAGGGTTGIVAKKLGRKSILIDCVRPYCIMAKYRLERTGYQGDFKI